MRGSAAHLTHTEGPDKLPQRVEHLKITQDLGLWSKKETSQLESTLKLGAVKTHASAAGRSMYDYKQEDIDAVEAPTLTSPEQPKHAAPSSPLLVNDPELERGIASAEPYYAPNRSSPHNRSGSSVHPLRPLRADRLPPPLESELGGPINHTMQNLGRRSKTLRETRGSNRLMRDSE